VQSWLVRWKDLDVIRSVFEESSIPINFNWGRGGGFPSLTRLRENVLLLEYLKKSRTQSMTGSSLLEFLPDRQADNNIWQENLRSLLTDWIDETHDTEQPVPAIEEYLYEALADQGRSKNLGNGVFLSTVHSVKGLEFDHVFILDGSWANKQGDEAEEERRLFYVAMSRARETLSLFSMNNANNPHNHMVNGEFVQTRSVDSFRGVPLLVYKYALLGMDDLFIDFAGMKKEEHSSRKAISGLKVGEDIWFKYTDKAIELVNKAGIAVGLLSKSAKNKWSKSLKEVEKAKVVVIVRRYREDNSDEAQQERCFGDKWEVPLVELKINSIDRCTASPVIIKDDNKGTVGASVKRNKKNKKSKKVSLSQKQNENIANGKPKNAGLPWTDKARESLANQFETNKSIQSLADIFQRTETAILAELSKQGLVDQKDNTHCLD